MHGRIRGRRTISLLMVYLCFGPFAIAQTMKGSLTLSPDPSTLRIDARGDSNTGSLQVSPNGVALDEVTLRASPLALGESFAFVGFPDNDGKDFIRLDRPSLKCVPNPQCRISYEVYGAWGNGTYRGTIDAYNSNEKIASAPITAVRPVGAFRPIVTGDAMHDNRITFDATSANSFLLAVQNPAGSPPYKFLLTDQPDDLATCAEPAKSSSAAAISFSPRLFQLEPGSTQSVIATVAGSLASGTHPSVLRITDCNDHDPVVWAETPIWLTKYTSAANREWWLLVFVVIGSLVSVLINNIFPVSRIKNGLRGDLRHVDEILRDDCPNASPALVNVLRAESKRLKLSLRQIYFWSPTKLTATPEAQKAVAALADCAAATRRISRLRSQARGATVSIRTHAQIREKLREAEEELLDGDVDAATAKANESQTKLTEAMADIEQTALKSLLTEDVSKLLKERAADATAPGAQNRAADAAAPGAQDRAADAAAPGAQDRATADLSHQLRGRIQAQIDRLNRDSAGVKDMSTEEIFDLERDYYFANIWIKDVEPKLAANCARFAGLANDILDALAHNPKSEYVQILIDLLRCDTTPDEIAAQLKENRAQVVCDPSPKYLESVDIAFTFADPLLSDVPAARRLLSYSWTINDGTTPPPNVDRYKHYFRASFLKRIGNSKAVFDVGLCVKVPRAKEPGPYKVAAKRVTPRHAERGTWTSVPIELTSFAVVTAIAVVTAFGAHYSSSIPNVLGWSDLLTAFMLGFGLDQLRNTLSAPSTPNATAAVPQSPSTASAPAPHA